MIKNKIWNFNNYEKKFQNGTFKFSDERGQHAGGEKFYTIKILKMTKCFITIKGNNWTDKIRCKILNDDKGFYIKPHKAFNSLFENFKLYSSNLKLLE